MILSLVDRFPPNFCRRLARKKHGRAPLSHNDLAALTGLGRSTIADLSKKTSWQGVSVRTMDLFMGACGVNPLQPKKVLAYMRSAKMMHLRAMTKTQRKFFKSLLAR